MYTRPSNCVSPTSKSWSKAGFIWRNAFVWGVVPFWLNLGGQTFRQREYYYASISGEWINFLRSSICFYSFSQLVLPFGHNPRPFREDTIISRNELGKMCIFSKDQILNQKIFHRTNVGWWLSNFDAGSLQTLEVCSNVFTFIRRFCEKLKFCIG